MANYVDQEGPVPYVESGLGDIVELHDDDVATPEEPDSIQKGIEVMLEVSFGGEQPNRCEGGQHQQRLQHLNQRLVLGVVREGYCVANEGNQDN